MRISMTRDYPFAAAVDAVVLVLTEAGAAKLPPEFRALDRTIGGVLTAALALKDFSGGEHTTFTLLTNGKLPAPRILLVGAGNRKDRTLLELQHIVGTAARTLQSAKCTRWALALPQEFRRAFRPEDLGRMIAKAAMVSTYHFHRYQSDPDAKFPMPEEVVVGPVTAAEQRKYEEGIAEGMMLAESMHMVRDLGNLPSSDATPTHLAERAVEIAAMDKRFHCTILDRADMEQLGMGALLGVSRGAATPPKCMVLEWRGNPRRLTRTKKDGAPPAGDWFAFVGKGITFDSGGISIKPGDKMDEMKFDMSGGAAVLGAMRAIGLLGLPVNIVGIVPACDNLPSGSAYKPGDILRTCRGKTLEVLNTDAEGRLVLADGIGYSLRYEPKAIVDVATLTGAIVVALGSHYTGLFANDAKLERRVELAAASSGDRVWRMPVTDPFRREVKSDIADLQNLGKRGREGGASTAAAFLEACAEGRPWAHLDIAGTAWTDRSSWMAKGATGVGVHLLVDLVRGWSARR
ncbi:leucyl aminopeptidase [Candidatus Uhrbacteria bacterium]|nr:leucyl aminopeptidase [Candidatus Uhrbacteria bacterium]